MTRLRPKPAGHWCEQSPCDRPGQSQNGADVARRAVASANRVRCQHLRDGTEKPRLERVCHSLIFEVVIERPLPDLPTYSALFEAASWRVDTVHRPVNTDRSGPKPAS